jgi:hypothetical protein
MDQSIQAQYGLLIISHEILSNLLTEIKYRALKRATLHRRAKDFIVCSAKNIVAGSTAYKLRVKKRPV